MIAGHHGRVPEVSALRPNHRQHGRGPWPAAQQSFVERVATELELDLAAFDTVRRPRRAMQLVVSGLIVMADWIASDDQNFDGILDLRAVTMDAARTRAAAAWAELGLRGGWAPELLADCPGDLDLVQLRFDRVARSSQRDVIELAEQMGSPGLLILEAPMGEGKTEAALAAAEVLARRFGADGLFVGMPTQATSDGRECHPRRSRHRRWRSRSRHCGRTRAGPRVGPRPSGGGGSTASARRR
ncbi:MAG: HD domain-containing protein [Pseudonocardia sp.]